MRCKSNLESFGQDPYQVLGVSPEASLVEIKAAYRKLVKKHHPDAGGDQQTILTVNAAWELLGDQDRRKEFDNNKRHVDCLVNEAQQRGVRNARASATASEIKDLSSSTQVAIEDWLQKVYLPIDRLLGKVINPFPKELRSLSADPYDDLLMEGFVLYLEKSRKNIDKVMDIYRSIPVPSSAYQFGLSLYYCLSQVEDGLSELERYTMGYVDNYLHDGKEMMREAKKRRICLKEERRTLVNS